MFCAVLCVARNEAAKKMSNEFAREFALSGQRVEFAGALKANVLTMLPENAMATVQSGTGQQRHSTRNTRATTRVHVRELDGVNSCTCSM